MMGDIVLFSTASSTIPIHAAVYIADDLLFTKNGGVYWSPWMLTTLDELKKMYTRPSTFLKVQYVRKRYQNDED